MQRTPSRDSASDPFDTSAQAAAVAFARRLTASRSGDPDARVLGVYLIGSLAHGGFSRRYSDIDVALVLDAADPGIIETMCQDARALSPELAEKLSLFWTDRGFATGRFPLLDRIDYIDHAIALVERERVQPPRPSRDDVRAYLHGPPLTDWAATARRFAAVDRLDAEDCKRYLRALLYPARFVFSWMTGGIASNDAAVAFLASEPPPGLDVALIERALACRRADADPDELFAARDTLRQQADACERLVASSAA